MSHSGWSIPVVGRAALLGVVAGMRSQLPFALLALAARQGWDTTDAAPRGGVLGSEMAGVGLGVAAAGELIGDKLPFTPSRLDPLPLTGRAVIGGAAGAVLARRAGASTLVGVMAGTAGSALGAFGGYHARVAVGRASGLPDPVWGTVEDAIAVGLGLLAVRR